MEKHNNENNNKRVIIMIIILIIIILSLITSCSCSIGFWGKLGDYFKREEIIPVIPGRDDKEVIKNKNLKFDVDEYRISLGEEKGKISYKIDGFVPNKTITCTTSNAAIATCYVVEDYVVIIPKGEGEVEVTIKTEENDKIYEANTKVVVTKQDRYIALSSYRGNIDLKYTKTKKFYYSLVGLKGTAKVTVSDSNIATATIKNGEVTVTAKKTGTVKVTVSIDYNGKNYTSTYTLTIKDSSSDKPVDPTKKESYLVGLSTNKGNLTPSFSKDIFEYEVLVDSKDENISIYPLKEDGSRLVYIVDGETVESLENIELPYGNTKVIVKTISAGKEPNEYVINIYRPKEVINDYYVTSLLTKYDMILSDEQNSRTIILDTNIFIGKTTTEKIKNGIRIYSNEDKSLYIDITTDSDLIGEIEYKSNEIGPKSLPIKVTANKVGKAIIEVNLYANGKVVKTLEIELNIEEKFILTLNANGGLFNELTKEYKFVLGTNDSLELVKYDIPYKLDDTDECKVFKFIGYSLEENGTIKYTVADIEAGLKLYGKDLTSSVTLYAIYETTSVNKDQILEKTIYITDIPLFQNDYYFNKYGEDKVIYPGAYGSYVAYIDNQTSNTITITGIILKEETICSDIGCLNMGYLIKHADGPYYYMGEYVDGKNDTYEILHNGTDKTTKMIDINENQTITIEPGKTKAISFFWKWVEIDNDVDTSIGNIAAKANDKYHLTIGLNYKINEKNCSLD